MDFESSTAQVAADQFRDLLTNVLDDLLYQVPNDEKSSSEKVKQALREISNMYRNGLRHAASQFRSSWDDPANRCAYVFLYLMHHSHLVYCSLQHSDKVLKSWRNKTSLKVCSVGGGPGSDLVGLITFLANNNISNHTVECRVLDLFPNWKESWDVISNHLPFYHQSFSVKYRKCDLVRDLGLQIPNLNFVKEADILIFSKSFSAVSAFYRGNINAKKVLRQILKQIKPGCFVLFIDNNKCSTPRQFQQEFASPAGLQVVFEFSGGSTIPRGQYPHTIRKYCSIFEFSPMRSCDVIIQLFQKPNPRVSEVPDRSAHLPTHHGASQFCHWLPVTHQPYQASTPEFRPGRGVSSLLSRGLPTSYATIQAQPENDGTTKCCNTCTIL